MKKVFKKAAVAMAVGAMVSAAHADISTDNGFNGDNNAGVTIINSLAGYDTSVNAGQDLNLNAASNVSITGNQDNIGNEGVWIRSQQNADNANGAYVTVVGNSNTMQAKGTNTIRANGSNEIIGTTNINDSNNAATNINTGTSTGNVTIGNAANVTNINSGTNNIGAGYASINNIGTGGTATTNNIGNSQTTTQVNAQAGNAKMTLANNSAVLTVPSGATNVNNGVAVTNTQASITGGTTSPTRMTMTDSAATFSRVSNGAPITVTGVADGRNDFDAINVRQFAGAIAAVAAQANVPSLAAGQDKTIGIGVGSFMSKTGLALGMNMRGDNNAVYKLSVSTGLNGGAKAVIAGGAAWAF